MTDASGAMDGPATIETGDGVLDDQLRSWFALDKVRFSHFIRLRISGNERGKRLITPPPPTSRVKDPSTRAETTALIETRNMVELRQRFATRMAFGTAGLTILLSPPQTTAFRLNTNQPILCAGLRAAMGCGFERMNQLTVIQTSQV